MCYIKDEYRISYKGENIGTYYVYTNKHTCFNAFESNIKPFKSELKKLGLDKEIEADKHIEIFKNMMKKSFRVPNTRKVIFKDGFLEIEKIPDDVDKFWVYRLSAEKGEDGYSTKKYDAPHYEGEKTPEGMREWASWYAFNKKDDGMFEAELDEAWWWGGGHNDGGTIRTEVPEEWLSLPYDEFLEKVVTLSSASHYGFTAEDLKKKKGLKEFFGFED